LKIKANVIGNKNNYLNKGIEPQLIKNISKWKIVKNYFLKQIKQI